MGEQKKEDRQEKEPPHQITHKDKVEETPEIQEIKKEEQTNESKLEIKEDTNKTEEIKQQCYGLVDDEKVKETEEEEQEEEYVSETPKSIPDPCDAGCGCVIH